MLWVDITQNTLTMSSIGLITDSLQSDSKLILRLSHLITSKIFRNFSSDCLVQNSSLIALPCPWLLPTHCETTYLDTDVSKQPVWAQERDLEALGDPLIIAY